MRLGGSLTTPSAALRTAQHNVEILTERLADDKRQLARRGLLWPLVAALLSFVAWQPFVRLDFNLWRADDGEYHLLRVYVFEAAVRAGEWLPRWTPDLFVGYGYPIFNFYAPGTYYLAMLLRLLGWDVYTTVQAQGAIATCAGAAGAYCLARAVFGGTLPGLTAALAFAYAPYPFITNLVIRADLAETLGLALLPWTLLAAWEAGRRPRRMAVLLLAGAMAAVILTHNLTALVTLPAAAIVGGFAAWHPGAVRGRRGTTETPTAATETAATAASGYPLKEGIAPNGRGPGDAVLDGRNGHPGLEAATAATPAGAQGQTRRRAGLGAVAAGLGAALLLTAFFWLPALVEQRDVHIEVALDGGHKAARTWLIDPLGATEQTRRSGNPQTVHGPLDLHLAYPYDLNYPPKPSLGQGALFAASAALTLAGLIARRRRVAGAAFFGAGTILLWLLTTTWSGWAWDHVPLMRFLQFSWRLYGPLALALGLAAAGAVAVAPAPLKLLPLLLAVFLAANTTTARPLWVDPEVERRVGGPQLVGTENATFGAGTTTGGEFVPRTVDLEALGPGRRRGNGVYERLYPEFGWLGGRVWVMHGRVRVAELAGGPTWTDARVVAETPGVLAFRTVAFPGWRAYLDGRPVEPRLAPRDAALDVAPGFITVPVPAGEHRVQIAFGPTPLRTAAAALSVLAVAGLGWWLAAGRRPAPQERAPTFPARRGAARRWPVARIAALTPAALLALSCTHDAIRPAMGAPAVPRPSDNRLVADLGELARRGAATINSPSGQGLGPFVNLQPFTIGTREGTRERRWLYMHPPSSVSVTLELPERAAFQAGLGLDPSTWQAEGADGVRFILEVTPEGGQMVRVFEEHVNPRAHEAQRAWLDRWIDLSAFGGRRVTLTMRTEAAQTPDFDWAGWADPALIVQRDARRPGGGPPTALPTPRAS